MQERPGKPSGEVLIHEPQKLTSIETGGASPSGAPRRAACVTCHTLRAPGTLPAAAGTLREFHRGLTVEHGGLSCASCHDPAHPQALRLADGTPLDMAGALRLCSQCHGPQRRDYDHGAHGGMSGSWDLSRGGRVRNHCVDCHDPHAPKFVGASPVLPPRDRLFEWPSDHEVSHD